MADFEHEDGQYLILDVVDNAVVAHPKAILVLFSLQFFDSGWAWDRFKLEEVFYDILLHPFWQGFELTLCRRRNVDAIRHGLPRQAQLTDQGAERLRALFPSFRECGAGVFKVNLILDGFQ